MYTQHTPTIYYYKPLTNILQFLVVVFIFNFRIRSDLEIPSMKKVVLKLDFADEKIKQKAMKKVSGLSGVESISFDQKDKKLTIVGEIDPVAVVAKLRKLCRTDVVSVGQKEEPKKEEPKKQEPKKEEPKKKDGPDAAQLVRVHPAFYQQQPYYYNPYQQPYFNRSVEEDPNACVIS